MPGDTKHDRWLWRIRLGLITGAIAVVGAIYLYRHFAGS